MAPQASKLSIETQLASLLRLFQHATAHARKPATTWQQSSISWDKTYLQEIVARAEVVLELIVGRYDTSLAIMQRVEQLVIPLTTLRSILKVSEERQVVKSLLWSLLAKLSLGDFVLPLSEWRKAQQQRQIGQAVADLQATLSSLEFLLKWEEE